MMVRKYGPWFLLLALAAVVAGGAVLYFARPAEKPVPVIFEPKLPSSPAVTLGNESTGELWRTNVMSADGKYVAQTRVGYSDGRGGIFHFNSRGKLMRFVGYSGEDPDHVIYEAVYEESSYRILRSRSFRPDGTLASEFRRLPDGTEEREEFDLDGVASTKCVITGVDGGQKTISVADGKVQVTELKAEKSEQSFGQRKAPDGKITPVLKLRLQGARVVSWVYFSLAGAVRHEGQYFKDGSVQVTVYNDKGQPVYRQTWRLMGEDWNRPYYRLKTVELFNEYYGRVSALVEMREDGVVPRTVTQFNAWDGSKSMVDEFDEKGFQLSREHFYNEHIPTNRQDFPPGQRQQLIMPRELLLEPWDDTGTRVYRFGGQPFAAPVGQGNGSPVFILP